MARAINNEDVENYKKIQQNLNDVLEYSDTDFFSYFNRKNADSFLANIEKLYTLYNMIIEGITEYPHPRSVILAAVFTNYNSDLRPPNAILSKIRSKFFDNKNFFNSPKFETAKSGLDKLDSSDVTSSDIAADLEIIDTLSLSALPTIYSDISVIVDILNKFELLEKSEISPQQIMYPPYEQLSKRLINVQGKMYAQAILNLQKLDAEKIGNKFNTYLDSILPLAKHVGHESLITESYQQFNAQLISAYNKAITDYKKIGAEYNEDITKLAYSFNSFLQQKLQDITVLYNEIEKRGIDLKKEKLENPAGLKINLELRIKCVDELKKVIEGINQRDTPEAKTRTKLWDSFKDTVGADNPETRAQRRGLKKNSLELSIHQIAKAQTPNNIYEILQNLKRINGVVGDLLYTNDLRLKLSGPIGNSGIIAEAEKAIMEMDALEASTPKQSWGSKHN